MRLWVQGLCIAGGISAAVGVTLWSTSSSGARSAAHYKAVAQQVAALDQQHASPEQTAQTRAIMQDFEQIGFDQHNPQAAVDKYFADDFVDHDPNVKGDKASVVARLAQLDWTHGGPQRTIVHLVADGPIAVVHHRLVRHPGDTPIAAVDIYRISNGKIVEHWDVLQPIPADSPNPAPMF